MSRIIRLHDMVLHTASLGPFNRCAIWLQGCDRHCSGCMSVQTQAFDAGCLISVEEIFHELIAISDIEGITISGGEPFLQIDALHELLTVVRHQTNLGVILYSGYYLAELAAMENPKAREIIYGLVDVVIDGSYVEMLNDDKGLRGSTNQNVHFITERYRPFEKVFTKDARKAEIRLNNQELFFVGVPDREMLSTWRMMAAVEK